MKKRNLSITALTLAVATTLSIIPVPAMAATNYRPVTKTTYKNNGGKMVKTEYEKYTYDKKNRIQQKYTETQIGSVTYPAKLTYAYKGKNVTSKVYSSFSSDDGTMKYNHTDVMTLNSKNLCVKYVNKSDSESLITYTYDKKGRVTKVTEKNGKSTFSYKDSKTKSGTPKTVQTYSDGDRVSRATVTYDKYNNPIKQVTQEKEDGKWVSRGTTKFVNKYDSHKNLKSVTTKEDGETTEKTVYTYKKGSVSVGMDALDTSNAESYFGIGWYRF